MFSHEPIMNKNESKEIVEMVEKLHCLKQEIGIKNEEIKKLNSLIEDIEKGVYERIIKLEKIVEMLKEEVNDEKKKNENLRCSPNSGKNENLKISESGDKTETVVDVVDEIIIGAGEKEYACEKCAFIGKTESGLKTHNTVKHKAESLTQILDSIPKKHSDKVLNCEGCEFSCKTENDLVAHKQLIHRRISLLLSCDQCDFKISRKTDLELHKRFNH